jgi:hypothetical protein
MKLLRPDLKSNRLWNTLCEKFLERLIVVVTANDLRLREMQISRALSRERPALELMPEVPKIPFFDSCAHFVVSM